MADRLDNELWFLELGELLEACDSAQEVDQSSLLARAHALIAVAPVGWSDLFEPLITASELEGKLSSAAYVDAALGLLGDGMGYMLSKSPRGAALATVWVAQSGKEIHAGGQTEAVAIVAALTSSIFWLLGEHLDIENIGLTRYVE